MSRSVNSTKDFFLQITYFTHQYVEGNHFVREGENFYMSDT